MVLETFEADRPDVAFGGLPALIRRDAGDLQAELDVLPYGTPGEQCELLEHHASVGAWPGALLPAYRHFSGGRLHEPCYKPEQSRLSASRGTDYGYQLALLDLQREILQGHGLLFIGLVDLPQMIDNDLLAHSIPILLVMTLCR